jgi:hypothetical protein
MAQRPSAMLLMLPNDLVQNVMGYICLRDVLSLPLTCKEMLQFLSDYPGIDAFNEVMAFFPSVKVIYHGEVVLLPSFVISPSSLSSLVLVSRRR